jgi:hypothetical protein
MIRRPKKGHAYSFSDNGQRDQENGEIDKSKKKIIKKKERMGD